MKRSRMNPTPLIEAFADAFESHDISKMLLAWIDLSAADPEIAKALLHMMAREAGIELKPEEAG